MNSRIAAIFKSEVEKCRNLQVQGTVLAVNSSTMRVSLPGAALRDRLSIETANNRSFLAEVIALDGPQCTLSPLLPPFGVRSGAPVRFAGSRSVLSFGPHLLGTVLESSGQIREKLSHQFANSDDVFSELRCEMRSILESPPEALSRKPIQNIFTTGIRAVDGFLTLGCGQRLGIFAEPGVGKSSLLGAFAANCKADVVVVALIGERGREVGEFVHSILPEAARMSSVVVYSTSDEPALARVNAALIGISVAEYFRDRGLNVLFLVDSLTRLCRAYREIGLAAGEPVVRRGYPPSVFARLPEFIERTGTNNRGSITALYTVLLSSDLDEDPMVDEIKGITDGHLVLRKSLAEKGHYPAIDINASISRLASGLIDTEMKAATVKIRSILSRLDQDRDLILLGGTPDSVLQEALNKEAEILRYLRQNLFDSSTFQETRQWLIDIANN